MNVMQPLISVIVPVYNVGPFLRPCLDSLAAQTYQNLEILLIDDGSTDGSGERCDEYAAKDPRFKVVHKENGGVSSARNLGLDLAQGKYIAFADSDDYVKPDYFEVLYRDIARHCADAAFCNYLLADESGTILSAEAKPFRTAALVTEQNVLLRNATNFGVVWGCLLSASLIGTHRFTALRYGEDSLFMFDLLCRNPVVFLDTYAGYTYVQRGSSATATREIPGIMKICDHLEVHAHRYLCLPETTDVIRETFFLRYANYVQRLAYLTAQPENRAVQERVRAVLDKHLRHILPLQKQLPGKLRFYILLCAKAPGLYNSLSRIHAKLRGNTTS